ncbi:MAG: zinc ribbon domain-containing protein, partial [Methanobrevibacter sp.]
GVDWGSRSAVASRYDSLTYESSSSETFNIDYYETVSWSVEFYKYE